MQNLCAYVFSVHMLHALQLFCWKGSSLYGRTGGRWERQKKKNVPNRETQHHPTSMTPLPRHGLCHPRGLWPRVMPWAKVLSRQWPMVLSPRSFAGGMKLVTNTCPRKEISETKEFSCRARKLKKMRMISESWVGSAGWRERRRRNRERVCTTSPWNSPKVLIPY